VSLQHDNAEAVCVCVRCRVSSVSSVQLATDAGRRSVDRIAGVDDVSVTTTNPALVIGRLECVSAHTTPLGRSVSTVCWDSMEMQPLDDQVVTSSGD